MNKSAQRERMLHAGLATENPNITEYTHTKDAFCHYDGWQYSAGTAQVFEIKVRDYSLPYLINNGARLEQQKFIAMVATKNATKEKKGINPDLLYINFTSTGYVIYNLPEHYNYQWTEKWCQKDDFSNEKVLKWCVDLPKELIVEHKYSAINTQIKYDAE